MALESLTGGAVYLDALVETNPTGADGKNQGDDHIRGIKNVLLNTFPNIDAAVTATPAELNTMDGITSTTAELNTLDGFTGDVDDLNILTGLTATAADLTLLAGLAAASMGVMFGDSTQKVWMYRNDALSGWAIDGTITDVVLGVSGGATYATGGAEAGSWTPVAHQLTIAEMPAHTHDETSAVGGGAYRSGANGSAWTPDGLAVATTSTGGDGTHTHGDATYRPAAAVGTIQYVDV